MMYDIIHVTLACDGSPVENFQFEGAGSDRLEKSWFVGIHLICSVVSLSIGHSFQTQPLSDWIETKKSWIKARLPFLIVFVVVVPAAAYVLFPIATFARKFAAKKRHVNRVRNRDRCVSLVDAVEMYRSSIDPQRFNNPFAGLSVQSVGNENR